MIDFRCGDWRTALADVERVDAIITDPPYGERTHAGQRHGRQDQRYGDPVDHPILSARGIPYACWSGGDVRDFALWCTEMTAGWICCFTSHDLIPAYMTALQDAGQRYVFAPIACVQHAMNVRLAGDGPSNWTTYLIVSRPRSWPPWGSLPGAYVGASHDPGENALDRSKRAVPGGKPLWLMRTIIRDYSRPGDLICDPCAGGGTTLIAAAMEGRKSVGSELDPDTYRKARARIARGYNQPLFVE